MKLSNLVFLFIFMFSQISFASCKQPVTYLGLGERAVCSGYLFSPEKEAEVRNLVQRYEILVEIVEKQELVIENLNNRVDLNQKISQNLQDQLDNKNSQSTLEKIIYFTLGIALGVGIAKVLN